MSVKDGSGTVENFSWLRLFAFGVFLVGAWGCADPAGDSNHKDILGTEKKLYSQFDEELIIRDFFQDRKGGFFLDVGSSRPIKRSTTYYLEKHLGWSGIGIDALAKYAPAYEKLRPNTRFFSYIVTDHAGTLDKFYRVKGTEGLSSTEKGRIFDGKKLDQVEIEVPTITLDVLLERNGVERIDFMSMDIEGGAPKALAGFSIEKYEVELVCIEHGMAQGKETPALILRWFAEHGYERIDAYDERDRFNWYFVPKK
jgi:FkbM family methyltransferase